MSIVLSKPSVLSRSMPNRPHSSPQAVAVAGPNLLFSLPPELRRMIYCLLLTHEERIPIAISLRDFPRRSERLRALKRTHDAHPPKVLPVKRPSLFPSIIHVCRLIHLEACPLLYSLNSFKFDQPSALSAFRWRSGAINAAEVKRIIIDIHQLNVHKWEPYLFDGKESASMWDWPWLILSNVTRYSS